MQNVVYELSWPTRAASGIKPYKYIGSKTNCLVVDGVIIDSHGKEYWSSCKQDRFIEALIDKPTVSILAETDIDNIINAERSEQLKVFARDNDDYFNLVYAGGGFGVFGKNHPAKRQEVQANMRASNYMNRDDFRPWKASRANPNDWKLANAAYQQYVIINLSTSYGGKCGWRRLINSGINITETTAKSMLKLFNSGWIPDEDPEFIKLAQQ